VVRKLESYLAEKARIQQDDSDLTSRSDLRKDRIKSEGHIFSVAVRLCELSDKRLMKLGIGDTLVELIVAARKIESPPARDRALRRIRRELRDLDLAALERELEALNQPTTKKPATPEEVWSQRLVTGSEPELDAFLREHQAADRGQLRALVRNVARAKGDEAGKPKRKLLAAIREALANRPQEPSDDGADAEVEDEDDSEVADRDGSDSSHE
jgi:ribosomal 50S subunit-associated protein YjgA (DUF615 family)